MAGDDGNELCILWKLFKTLYLNGAKIQTFVYKEFPKINVMMSGSDLKKKQPIKNIKHFLIDAFWNLTPQ